MLSETVLYMILLGVGRRNSVDHSRKMVSVSCEVFN
jgi:hypothetical protein